MTASTVKEIVLYEDCTETTSIAFHIASLAALHGYFPNNPTVLAKMIQRTSVYSNILARSSAPGATIVECTRKGAVARAT